MKGYLCKIVVKWSRPKAWREVIIPEGFNFQDVHDIIQIVMGLSDYHLYFFKLSESLIVCDLSGDAFEMWDFYEKLDTNTTSIDKYFKIGEKIFYRYDFGDEWEFDIEIKDIIEYDKKYPTIKRFRGKYDLLEDCKAAGGWNCVVAMKDNPDGDFDDLDRDFEYLIPYLTEFDKNYVQSVFEERFF